jgi:hypothetical protein
MRSIGIWSGAWIAAAMMMMAAAPIGFAGDRAAGPAEVQRLPRPYGLDISCASNHGTPSGFRRPRGVFEWFSGTSN